MFFRANLCAFLSFQPEKRDSKHFLIDFGVSVKDIADPRNQISNLEREISGPCPGRKPGALCLLL